MMQEQGKEAQQALNQVKYVIHSLSEGGMSAKVGFFWSNRDGWGALETATRFTTHERMDSFLPISRGGDSEWMLIDEALDLTRQAPVTDRPLAIKGLHSYRYKGAFGWIMIGAKDHREALQQASRSTNGAVSLDNLQRHDGAKYVFCEQRPGQESHMKITERPGALKNKEAVAGWKDSVTERLNGWGLVSCEIHRIALVSGTSLVFFSRADADFSNPAALTESERETALAMARNWAKAHPVPTVSPSRRN